MSLFPLRSFIPIPPLALLFVGLRVLPRQRPVAVGVPEPRDGVLRNYEVGESEVPRRGSNKGETETKLVHLPRSADALAEVREKTGGYPAVGDTLYAVVGYKLLAVGDEANVSAVAGRGITCARTWRCTRHGRSRDGPPRGRDGLSA